MNAQVKFVVHYGKWRLNVLDLPTLQKWVDSGRVKPDSQVEICDTFEVVEAMKIQGLRFEGVETFPAQEPAKDQPSKQISEKSNVANIGKIDPQLDRMIDSLWRCWLMIGCLICVLLATAWGASFGYKNPADTFAVSLIGGVIFGGMFVIASMGMKILLEVARKVLSEQKSDRP